MGGEKLDKGESEAAAGKDSDRNPANGKKDKTKRPSDNATAAVKTPEAAIDAGTKETKEVEDSAATSSDKTAELTSSKHPSAEASAPAKSASRTSSSGLPPAPAPSGPKRTSSSDVGGQGKAKANAALEPSKQAAAAERADTAESTPDEALDESAPTVKALREQLSQVRAVAGHLCAAAAHACCVEAENNHLVTACIVPLILTCPLCCAVHLSPCWGYRMALLP